MRTDLYFVLQDLAGTRDLYHDSWDYLRYKATRLRHPLGPRRTDPSRELPANERRAVLAYSTLLLPGTIACLGAAVAITLPATVAIFARAIRTVLHPQSTNRLADAGATLTAAGSVQLLWARAWWRQHANRARNALRDRPTIDDAERREPR